jgi:hypothetical protein
MSVEKTISERKSTHGDFYTQASSSVRIINALEGGKNWRWMEADQKEALILIAVKLGRILTGNAYEPDHWHDIAGYAQLVENRLNGLPSNGNVPPSDLSGLVAAAQKAAHQESTSRNVPNYSWDKPEKANYAGTGTGDKDGRIGRDAFPRS